MNPPGHSVFRAIVPPVALNAAVKMVPAGVTEPSCGGRRATKSHMSH